MTTPSPKVEQRFWSKVDRRGPDECWPWRGAPDPTGYGTFCIGSKNFRAHRMAAIYSGLNVTPTLQIDHLCRNRICVNPAHLELVTSRENTRRGQSPAGLNAKKTHCLKGHPLSGSNLRIARRSSRPDFRMCIQCTRKLNRDWANRNGR